MRDGGIEDARLAVHIFKHRAVGDGAQRFSPAVAGSGGEGVEGGLADGLAAVFGHDGGDDVDQLRQTGGLDDVAVVEQGVHQPAEDDGVAEGVHVFQQVGRLHPVGRGAFGALRPDVPLVEADIYVPLGALFGLDVADGGAHGVDELRHVVGAAQKVEQRVFVALFIFVIAVHGQKVRLVVGIFQHDAVPFGIGGHIAVAAAAHHQLGGARLVRLFVFRPAQHARRLQCLFAVALRVQPADLPFAVHLVADAPVSDAVRGVGGVFAAEIGKIGARGVIAVFKQLQRVLRGARAHIDGEHGLDLRLFAPAHELVGAELVALYAHPGEVQAGGAGSLVADAVLPVVPGNEVAAGVADDGHAQFADELQHVLPEAVGIRGGVPRLVDAAVYGAAEVLDERAVDMRVYLPDGHVPVCKYFDLVHVFLP